MDVVGLEFQRPVLVANRGNLLLEPALLIQHRQRSPGGDRKRAEDRDPGLGEALERLADPATRGDPTGPLRWTSLIASRLAAALRERGTR